MENNIINIKRQLKGLTLDELKEYFKETGEPAFRGEQLFNWMYNHLAVSFDEMQNFSKQLRAKLSGNCLIQALELVTVQDSPQTGTKKFLFQTSDERKIESVIIPDGDRATLCISTQVGCPLDCKFCATGLMGYKRNLTVGEVVDQYLLAAREYGKDKITNIVYMGMGEPLLNYKATLSSLSIFTAELTKGLSRNRITVSTSGIAPKIRELADSGFRVKLALSLHSCFEDVRSTIMPINNKFSLKDNIESIKYFARKTGSRITFEYTMLKGINDRKEDVKALIKLCSQIPSKINIIPFNSIAHMNPGGISATLEPTPLKEIEHFAQQLRDNNITVMIRETQGNDIAAACGQLAAKY
ncbi:MAG: 23S rRNA (adenine(2503)-C(2))-methyltransferase RlmN [Ignavibacteria bacterium]|jgi:23S rRNA (adenine2503-C2)-methyltransferase|nr:23S rRNA (adenine(2503)-C(2))-methyltransferase RlmN [Ignavibacteria bacterium]MCU7504834.1 23S rRNA (adenine(2503)-C(2))-methyltransferase RlmN [Ignavibacteria bacterium]MCU7517720.1 23S rRNA (adenine(2503)-C(2))-methyltransferase RlmN [Ignavibacteria bacterium]